MELAATGLAAAAFALIHLVGARFDFLRTLPRSIWLSIAGGVSVAYVFVHILPDLARHQQDVDRVAGEGVLAAIESHVWVLALVGLAAFYGLERLARRRPRDEGEGAAIFWVHLGAFALYNLMIGYLLVHREDEGGGLFFYAVAMGFHFLVTDQGLREHHGNAYRRGSRWLLAAAPLLGWALGATSEMPPLMLSAAFAFLAGGIVLNVLKEELPEDRESRFWAFAAGAAGYTAFLMVAG